MAKVTITKTALINSIDPARMGKKDMLVTFTTDGGVSGYVQIPKEAPSFAEIQAAINGFYKTQEHVGKTFETL